MRTRALWLWMGALCAISSLSLWTPAQAQETQAGEIKIPAHWSPYKAPTSYPEGTKLHIIVKGDTLWDLANRYFTNPFLWPQLWDANRYITNPHWIYPGDPLVIPEPEVVRGPGEEAAGAELAPGEAEEAAAAPGVGEPGAPAGPSLYPLYEEVSAQCAGYVADSEDESFRVIGSEEGHSKIGMATGDILYINRGTQDGIQPGEMYYLQRRRESVPGEGWRIIRTGWATVLATQERTAIAEVTQACIDVRQGDYLKPFEPVPVPLIPVQSPPNRLTPETGKTRGEVVASMDKIRSMGQGHLVSLDVGEEDGVIPGNLFTIYRYLYSGVQRKVLGELAILTVQRKTATAKIITSYDYILVGDLVEMR